MNQVWCLSSEWFSNIEQTVSYYVQFYLQPWDLEISRGHLLSRGNRCTKFSNCQVKGWFFKYSVDNILLCTVWPLSLWLQNEYGTLWDIYFLKETIYFLKETTYFLKETSIPSLMSVRKAFSRYWTDNILLCPVWPLTLWPVN